MQHHMWPHMQPHTRPHMLTRSPVQSHMLTCSPMQPRSLTASHAGPCKIPKGAGRRVRVGVCGKRAGQRVRVREGLEGAGPRVRVGRGSHAHIQPHAASHAHSVHRMGFYGLACIHRRSHGLACIRTGAPLPSHAEESKERRWQVAISLRYLFWWAVGQRVGVVKLHHYTTTRSTHHPNKVL